jgi:hypothetical protein
VRYWLGLSLFVVMLGGFSLYKVFHRPISQPSCSFVQNVDFQRVSWQHHLPVHLYVHHSVPVQYYAAIERAISVWNSRLGLEALRVDGWGIDQYDTPQHDGMSIIYWLHEWDSDKPSEQARTTIYWTGNQIYEADMRINAKNFQFFPGDEISPFYTNNPQVPPSLQPPPPSVAKTESSSTLVNNMMPPSVRPNASSGPVVFTGVDFESLVLHELGHVLGLAHTATIGSVMVPSLASGYVRRMPSVTDIQALKCEY